MAQDVQFSDLAHEVMDRHRRSFDWMSTNFYGEWTSVYKSYRCERDPELDQNGKADLTQTSVGMPDTFALVQRGTARVTAQIPDLRHTAQDKALADMISRTLMYQWDYGRIQRQQKRHVRQALCFGWSVRAWYWANETYTRKKRVDIMQPDIAPEVLQQIAETYGVDPNTLADPLTRAQLLSQNSRGGLLPVQYQYKAFEGPKCDFLFIGDCFPEPNFTSIQNSKYFIVQRRRDLDWIKRTVKAYPDLAQGFDSLLTAYPNGTEPLLNSSDRGQTLRDQFNTIAGRLKDTQILQTEPQGTMHWTITEMHVPGLDQSISYVGERDQWIGKIPYPYDLDGKIAFTELTFIDDLLQGVGDSTARFIRGIQKIHDRQVNRRVDLMDTLARPLVGTSNRQLYENPDQLKRMSGMRLILMRNPGDMWVQSEQAALASGLATMQDESALMRMYQMATGESNMSMAANVDPSQNRTATGARLLAYGQDVLTKDQVDMFDFSINADAEMMLLLNRSELSDSVEFDGSKYDRQYSPEKDLTKQEWMRAEPELFQAEGQVIAKTGSTLADDDEANVQKATTLWTALSGRPDVNQSKLLDEFLIAMGKGAQLAQFHAPPPPPPNNWKDNFSVAAKLETMPADMQQAFLNAIGIQVQVAPAEPQGPPPAAPGSPGPPPPPHQVPTMAAIPPPPPPPGAGALDAARGHSPLQAHP